MKQLDDAPNYLFIMLAGGSAIGERSIFLPPGSDLTRLKTSWLLRYAGRGPQTAQTSLSH